MLKNSSGTTRSRQVVSIQSFEDFDVISMVDENSDPKKLLSMCFNNNIGTFLRPFPLKVLYTRKTASARKRLKPICAIITSFP